MKKLLLCAAMGAALLGTSPVLADSFSFTGNFAADDNVQLFNFSTAGSSNVILRTWSYAGGTNAAGASIARGGFDPILALFDSTGALIGQNDDGGAAVAADAVTGNQWDTYLDLGALGAGSYTVSVMEYDNFAFGPNLSNGFLRDGQGNFTGPLTGCAQGIFCDVSGSARDSHWAFDILGVTSADVVDNIAVPEPASISLLGAALLGGLLLWRRRKTA